jgi:hypothetical protein
MFKPLYTLVYVILFKVLNAELVLSALKLTNVEIGNINDSVISVLADAVEAG